MARPETRQSVGFDGSQPWSTKGATQAGDDLGILESILNDSNEEFFLGQVRGAYSRLLGRGFRLDDGKSKVYTQPYYDVFEGLDPIQYAQNPRTLQTKVYLFNSATGLLELVRYKVKRNGVSVDIETRWTNWTKVQGQQVPQSVVRTEDGRPVFSMTVISAALAAKAPDNIFRKPAN